MADSYIPVTPGTGENMQTYENSVSGTDVHAEAVVLVDSSGSPIATLPISIAAVVQTKEVPDATSTFAPTNATSTAFEASRVIKAAAGVLFTLTVYSSRASAQFIQLHNAAAVPADGVAPVLIFRVGANQGFSMDWGKFGRFFSTGIVICNSSTADTKTVGASDCWFDAQYS